MKHYIIDGNNLIGKISALKKLQKKDKQSVREKLAFLVDRYFTNHKAKVSLHFDGFRGDLIKSNQMKIVYSNNQTADDLIKREIENSVNPKNVIVVTSDNNLSEFAKVCSCNIIKSEDFVKKYLSSHSIDEEQSKINELSSTEEFKKLFGVNTPPGKKK